MNITLRQLRYATALARTRHFGRAAEACFVTQPALSQQIRQLEEACGTPLFDRLAKTVRPTPFGLEFLERAQSVLDQNAGLEAFVEAHRGRPMRPLRFGLIPTVAPYLLPDIFPALRAALPDLEFAASESRTDALLAGLAEGTLDLALIATDLPPGGPRLAVAPLFADPFYLATASDEAVADPVALGAIDAGRVLLLDEGHCLRDQAIAACAIKSAGPSRAFAATSLSTIVEFVANGQGVTLLPRIALKKEAGGNRIGVHALAAPGAGRDLSLVWREGSPFAEMYEKIALVICRSRPEAAEAAASIYGLATAAERRP